MTSWSSERPTEPGLWWWRAPLTRSWQLARFIRLRDGRLALRLEGASVAVPVEETFCDDWEWQPVVGPLP